MAVLDQARPAMEQRIEGKISCIAADIDLSRKTILTSGSRDAAKYPPRKSADRFIEADPHQIAVLQPPRKRHPLCGSAHLPGIEHIENGQIAGHGAVFGRPLQDRGVQSAGIDHVEAGRRAECGVRRESGYCHLAALLFPVYWASLTPAELTTRNRQI